MVDLLRSEARVPVEPASVLVTPFAGGREVITPPVAGHRSNAFEDPRAVALPPVGFVDSEVDDAEVPRIRP